MFSRAALRRALAGCAALFLASAFAAEAQQRPTRPAGPKHESERREEKPARPAPPRKPTATLFFCETRDVQCRTSITEFGIDDVRDLFIFAAYRNLSGEHVQRLRLVMPDGNTYQVTETKFTTEDSASGPGMQVAVRSREDFAVSVALPVAGTHITQRSLTGAWSVELYLDGKLIATSSLTFRPRN